MKNKIFITTIITLIIITLIPLNVFADTWTAPNPINDGDYSSGVVYYDTSHPNNVMRFNVTSDPVLFTYDKETYQIINNLNSYVEYTNNTPTNYTYTCYQLDGNDNSSACYYGQDYMSTNSAANTSMLNILWQELLNGDIDHAPTISNLTSRGYKKFQIGYNSYLNHDFRTFILGLPEYTDYMVDSISGNYTLNYTLYKHTITFNPRENNTILKDYDYLLFYSNTDYPINIVKNYISTFRDKTYYTLGIDNYLVFTFDEPIEFIYYSYEDTISSDTPSPFSTSVLVDNRDYTFTLYKYKKDKITKNIFSSAVNWIGDKLDNIKTSIQNLVIGDGGGSSGNNNDFIDIDDDDLDPKNDINRLIRNVKNKNNDIDLDFDDDIGDTTDTTNQFVQLTSTTDTLFDTLEDNGLSAFIYVPLILMIVGLIV